MENNNEENIQEEELKQPIDERIIEKIECSICNILDEGLTESNLDILYKLVDIHKDIHNEKYWKVKEREIMRYENYNAYNNYGGYNAGNYGREQYGAYGRRGGSGRYRGHDYMDGMYEGYGRYEEGREQYNRGNYGAKDDTLKSLEYMLESTVDFFKMLKSEANSQEEMQLIREYSKKISEM